MTVDWTTILASVVTAFLAAYLTVALLKPETFS
jgi:K+-transporting ATPase KdpF subunit